MARRFLGFKLDSPPVDPETGVDTRPWYKRLTLVAGSIFALVTYLQAKGYLPAGTTDGFQHVGDSLKNLVGEGSTLVQYVSALLTLLGMIRTPEEPTPDPTPPPEPTEG